VHEIAADYDCDLDSQAMYLANFGGDLVHTLVVDAKPLSCGQCLAGNF
jgi:hypothetical protein